MENFNLIGLIGLILMSVPILLVYFDITEDENVKRGKGTITVSTILSVISIFLITYKG